MILRSAVGHAVWILSMAALVVGVVGVVDVVDVADHSRNQPRKHRHGHGENSNSRRGNKHKHHHNIIITTTPEPDYDALFREQAPDHEYWGARDLQLHERPPGHAGCMYNRYYFEPMQLFMLGDGCNTCVCDGYNHMICTLLDCGHNSGCNFHGESYDIWEHWPLGIGCQVCNCYQDGYIECFLDSC